jgi:hypothetical protein
MKLSEPKVITFIIAVFIAFLGLLGYILAYFAPIPLLSAHPFWILSIAFILLVLANLFKGL